MENILKPITDIFSKIFTVFYQYMSGFGIDKGTSYVMVILLTILVRLLILPLTMKQLKSQAGMQEIQPLLKEVQQKYKNNPEKLNAETMRIYKENNVSMAGGCYHYLYKCLYYLLFIMYFIIYQGLKEYHSYGYRTYKVMIRITFYLFYQV